MSSKACIVGIHVITRIPSDHDRLSVHVLLVIIDNHNMWDATLAHLTSNLDLRGYCNLKKRDFAGLS